MLVYLSFPRVEKSCEEWDWFFEVAGCLASRFQVDFWLAHVGASVRVEWKHPFMLVRLCALESKSVTQLSPSAVQAFHVEGSKGSLIVDVQI